MQSLSDAMRILALAVHQHPNRGQSIMSIQQLVRLEDIGARSWNWKDSSRIVSSLPVSPAKPKDHACAKLHRVLFVGTSVWELRSKPASLDGTKSKVATKPQIDTTSDF